VHKTLMGHTLHQAMPSLQSIAIKANHCCRSTEALHCFRWHHVSDMSKP